MHTQGRRGDGRVGGERIATAGAIQAKFQETDRTAGEKTRLSVVWLHAQKMVFW